MNNEAGLKFDTGKPPMSLLDRYALEQIALVLAFGAKKYAAHNWRNGIAYSRLLDACLRHVMAFADGEELDPESGLPHLAHAGCCIMFLIGMTNTRPDLDDRYKAEPVAKPLPYCGCAMICKGCENTNLCRNLQTPGATRAQST